jgi:outer membrane protein assembly factor BamB
MTGWKARLVVAATAVLAACDSGGGVSCSLDAGMPLAPSTFPKFRADLGNTGRAAVDLNGSTGNIRTLFDGFCSAMMMQTCSVDVGCPSELGTCTRIGLISATPILDAQTPAPNIYLGSADGTVYAVDATGEMLPLENPIELTSAIVGSPLLGLNPNTEPNRQVLSVPGNSLLAQFDVTLDEDEDGNPTISGGQVSLAAVGGFITASPNIWNGDENFDGTVFFGTESGVFTGICPNGVARWSVSFPATQSSAALVQDPNFTDQVKPIIIAGGLNGVVRGYSISGRQAWSFFASASIGAAVMIDPSSNLAYVADTAGRVFVLNIANGQPVTPLPQFTASTAITASPALGRDDVAEPRLYVADQNGVLYALDRDNLTVVYWTFQAAGPINSSPAVATLGDRDVIVFGADVLGVADPTAAPVAIDGKVYAIRDDGDSASLVWVKDIGYSIGTASPSIGINRTVYIGREGNRLGSPTECPNVDRDNDGEQDACVVNAGGALYEIRP